MISPRPCVLYTGTELSRGRGVRLGLGRTDPKGARVTYLNAAREEHKDLEAEFPGLISRYFRVLFSPDLLFQRLRSRPDWLGAVILGGGLMAAGAMLLPPDMLLATFREQALQRGQPLPQGLEDLGGGIRYVSGAAALVFWPVVMAIYAALVMLFFAILLGHEGTYRQYLAVVAHAQLIVATSGLLLSPLRIAMEDAQILLSVGTFAVFLDDGYTYRFLSFLDLFGLWAWMLVGLGAARIGRKKSWIEGAIFVSMIPVITAAIVAIFV